MSGGSYDYLCYKSDIGSLASAKHRIAEMHNRLHELGHHDAAIMTEEVLAMFDRAMELQDVLETAWHAVEWYDSCDYGPESFDKAMTEWREKVKEKLPPKDIVELARRADELQRKAEELGRNVAEFAAGLR